MKDRSRLTTLLHIFFIITALLPLSVHAEALFSESWGFRLDLPEGYDYTDGDGRNKFSFYNQAAGGTVDIIVYENGRYDTPEKAAQDVIGRLKAAGDIALFDYENRQAALLQLQFEGVDGQLSGWGLCVELDGDQGGRPLMLTLSYGPTSLEYLDSFHLSILDSIAPGPADNRRPGPVSHFSYPPSRKKLFPLSGIEGLSAFLGIDDAEASQALVDREFSVLAFYIDSPLWQEAWKRYYRAIYRDSFDRLSDLAFALERHFAPEPGLGPQESGRRLAEALLHWVQEFYYERDFMGSDFVNPVSAVLEGRGDCDSRALLWAILLRHANITSAMMVSREYGHAMGLAELEGDGARFMLEDKEFLVAETTAQVPLGLIGSEVADPEKWLGIRFE